MLFGYGKNFSTETGLFYFIEIWKFMLDKKGYAGAILMDLSKAFDAINREILVAKPNAMDIVKKYLN